MVQNPIGVLVARTSNSEQLFVKNECLVKQVIFDVMIWNHRTEATNKIWLLRVPGSNDKKQPRAFSFSLFLFRFRPPFWGNI